MIATSRAEEYAELKEALRPVDGRERLLGIVLHCADASSAVPVMLYSSVKLMGNYRSDIGTNTGRQRSI